MKSITIEKIPEGDAAREGARSHLRARALALRQAQRPRGGRERTSESEGGRSERQRARMAGANVRERRKGANARERGLSSCVIVIGSLSTKLYTFSGEQPTHYAQPTD